MNPLLRAMMEAVDDDDGMPADISVDGKVELLRDMAERYQAWRANGCPFKPGDFVTPRKDSGLRGAGEPYVVLEVCVDAQPHFTDEVGSVGFGRRNDVRVGWRHRDGEMATHWTEAFRLKPWSAE